MKPIYYFTNGTFNYPVSDDHLYTLLEEDHFLKFNERNILDILKETLELETFDLDDVFDDIRERSWNEWDGKQNYLSKKTVDDINKDYNINLTVNDFGEIMYYDCGGECTEITYTEARTGEGRWDNDTTVRYFATAEKLTTGELLEILEEDKDYFIDALKERNATFGEFIEKIIENKDAVEEFLFCLNKYDDAFYYENKTKQELTNMLNAGDFWNVVDD